jgi:Protein ENHANCED DISEASE RESISTANCE 2, C-terminal
MTVAVHLQDIVQKGSSQSDAAAAAACRFSEDSFVSISVWSDGDDENVVEERSARNTPPSFAVCLPLPRLGGAAAAARRPRVSVPAACMHVLECGGSQLTRVPPGADADLGALPPFSYQQADAAIFQLRQKGYAKSKCKGPSQGSVYELAAADLYATNSKHFHIVKRLQLPPPVNDCRIADGRTLDEADIPQLLVLHIMMPTYPGTFFPTTDGPNVSFVYYFRLPATFDPATFHTPEVRRWVCDCTACSSCQTGSFRHCHSLAKVAIMASTSSSNTAFGLLAPTQTCQPAFFELEGTSV